MENKELASAVPAPGSHASHEAGKPSSPSASIPDAWEALKHAIQTDPEYAWGWHCNLAVPIMDAVGASHKTANIAAAYLMSALWEHDITGNKHYQYGKSDAQSYHEMMIALDRDSDRSGEASETQSGSTAGESAGPQDIANPSQPIDSPPKDKE